MTDKTTNLLLRIAVDQGAASQGVKALQDIQSGVDSVRVTMLEINKDAAQTSDVFKGFEDASKSIGRDSNILNLASQFADLAKLTGDSETQLINLRTALRDLGASSDEIDKATESFEKLADAENKAQSAGGDISFTTLGRAANGLGLPGGRQVAQLGDLQRISKELEGFTSTLANVGDAAAPATALVSGFGGELGVVATAAGLVVPAVVAAVAVLTAFNNEIADFKKNLDSAVSAVEGFYDDLTKGVTTAQAQAKVDQLNTNVIPARQTEIDQFQKLIDAQVSEHNLGGLTKQEQEALPLIGPAFQSLYGALEKAQGQLDDAKNAVGVYTGAIHDNAFAANDAAAARKKADQDTINSNKTLVDFQIQAAGLIADGTSKGVQAQIDQNKRQIAGNNELIGVYSQLDQSDKTVTDSIAQLKDQNGLLAGENGVLLKSVLPLVQAREEETKAIDDETKAHDKAVKELQKAQDEYQQASNDIDQLTTDRAKQLKDEAEKDATDTYRASVEKDYANQIAAAKRDEAEQAERDKRDQADSDALTKNNDDRAKINATEFDGELKAYQTYIDAEKKQTDQANKQRLQTLETAQNDLKNLAAAGDVAGFVQRSNQAKLDLKHLAENTDAAQQQLYDNYQKQVQAARDTQTKQLDDLKATYDREKQIRDDAAQRRIQDIENQGNADNSKSSQLEQQLNDIRAQWRQDDLDKQRQQESDQFDQRLAVQQEKQTEALTLIQQYWDAQKAMVPVPLFGISNGGTASPPGFGIDVGPSIPSHADGLHRVPRDGYIASLHEGERILTRQQTDDLDATGGGRGDHYHVAVYNTVGDIATKSMLDQYQDETINGIKQTLIRSKGRGSQ